MSSEISRREFIRLSGLFALSFLVPANIEIHFSQLIPDKTKNKEFPFINQKNQSQCAIASMTMLVASLLERTGKSPNVEELYDQVLETTKRITGR